MSGWHALNVESDDEGSDVEIDNTKELQIEEALKLYQAALKYHAEGPRSFDKAAEAYQELFDSDIFRYAESQPELRRIELFGPLPEDDAPFADGVDGGPVVATASLETGPSTLPQILHLSHKNYAQFKLEYLTSRLDSLNIDLNQILLEAASAIDHFVQALDKDDTDLDLWRRTAAVGEMLDSKRIARFCLEAVLEGDDEGLSGALSMPGLDESLASEHLLDLVQQLNDQLSILQAPIPPAKRKVLSKMLKQRLTVYGEIAAREKAFVEKNGMPDKAIQQPGRIMLKAPSTWAEVGDALLRQLSSENFGAGGLQPGSAIGFDVAIVARPLMKAAATEPETMSVDTGSGSEEPSLPPSSILDQFPGMDKGKPTVQPQIAPADPSMISIIESDLDAQRMEVDSPTMTLPSRKRSGEAAGLQHDGSEEGRSKSRRTRARDSNADVGDNRQAMIEANIRWEYEQQLKEFEAVDDWVFDTVGNLFERIGVVGFSKAKDVRQEITTDPEHTANGESAAFDALRVAKQDILSFLRNYTDQVAVPLLQGGDNFDFVPGPIATNTSSSPGMPAKKAKKKLPLPNDGLPDFLQAINDQWLPNHEVAFAWLVQALLQPGRYHADGNTYTQFLWPEALKTMIVRTLVNFDESLFDEASRRLQECIVHFSNQPGDELAQEEDMDGWAEVLQAIFELHLDIYMLIKQPNSGVDIYTITSQGDRLGRWALLAREAMHFRSQAQRAPSLQDALHLRFLWATTFNIAACDDVVQDHIIECMNDLRAVFVMAEEPVIYLQNNAVMPELSVAALDRELSRLTTRDFFLKVTSEDLSDPTAVIENLEPLLLALEESDRQSTTAENVEDDPSQRAVQVSPELVRFLKSSDMSVRFLLWQRLRDAYVGIDYKPMIVATHFRMMRMILDELKVTTGLNLAEADRQSAVLKSLRLLQSLVVKTLTLMQSDDAALECIDEAALKSAVLMFGEILQLLQVFNVFEDSLRVGKSQPPMQPNGSRVPTFAATTTLMHEMQLHIWMILYALLREAIYQNSGMYPEFVEDKFEFLRSVHRNLGLRGICGGSNRMFVRMLKDEFVNMKEIENYDSEQAQVLYDLYGLNCFLNPAHDLIEHHCTHDAFLERGVAIQAVNLLLAQANKIPVKDLVKHPLKDTIDKVHGAAPRKKPTETILRNREIYRGHLRSPINPMDLYGCLKGEGSHLAISPVPKEDAMLAFKGWYFLMGNIALTKFKSQKRTAPTPTEDVDIAIAFFMQDLEFSGDNWETWFRLAQAYDTKIEESAVWSAEKLNNNMSEIVALQKAAIHCYILASALAHRSASLDIDTQEKLLELYQEFGMRLYSTSREPFSMLPFDTNDQEKFLSTPQGMDKKKPWKSMRLYTTWKLARTMFMRATRSKSQGWHLQYILGKCLWKMHSASPEVLGSDDPPSADEVLAAIIKSIELLPDKKDSRERKEPTLEPHYKLVSVVHKMVVRGSIGLEQAREALENTQYAQNLTSPATQDEWVPYVLSVLKNLRAADKSNWHHRMVARAAHIIYAEDQSTSNGASSHVGVIGAKHELTQQMFTKTMVLQVWRPECERAGRHFVYTSRYTRFFTQILEQLRDRPGLEALARRVRRRPHDMFEHGLVWQEICNAYLRLLRSYANLSEGLETSTFSSIVHDEFLQRKEPLERWMQIQDTGASPALDVLREVQELKKINQSLMKPAPIDDLIGDAYAQLFATIGKTLWQEEQRIKQEEEARRPPPAASPPRNPMMSLNHLMNVDGASDVDAARASSANTAPIAAQPEPLPRKKVGVGRREIRLCAEACNQKASAAIANRAANTRVEVVINTSRSLAGEYFAHTSAPGSVDDDADDESELSELEEDEAVDEDENGEDDVAKSSKPAPLFPHLPQTRTESQEGSLGFETADEGPLDGEGDVEMGGAGEEARVVGADETRTLAEGEGTGEVEAARNEDGAVPEIKDSQEEMRISPRSQTLAHHMMRGTRTTEQASRLAISLSSQQYVCRTCRLHAAHQFSISTRAAAPEKPFYVRWRDTLLGLKESSVAAKSQEEKTKQRLGKSDARAPGELGKKHDRRGTKYEVAARVDPSTHKEYVQAQTWDGLEKVGGVKWVKARADRGEPYVGFVPRKGINLHDQQWRRLLHHITVEALVLQKAGRGAEEICNPRAVGNKNWMHTKGAAVQPSVDGGLTVSFTQAELEAQVVRGIIEDNPEKHRQHENDLQLRRGLKQALAFSPKGGTVGDAATSTWTDITLQDPSLKLAILKRIMQLTGHRLPDFAISKSKTLADLYDALKKEPEPKKLAHTTQLKKLQDKLPNVRVYARKQTLVDKEMKIGRWKLIEDELVARDLPVFGNRYIGAKAGVRS
ncbi:histone transcription regulator 3 [Teratosphaeria destructans]|uniref:Histone transcription regulator 3 homolog n=1 Tax=Teratosphaeria destructans TaxID=418781 RepID=A0A9W7T0L0_9PEZI|nr:histone transcription regulator 3 [Teratosphaeria destructans]